MSLVLSFYLMTTVIILITIRNTTGMRYKIAIKNYTATSAETENLEIILNYFRNEQRLYPSIISLVSADARSTFLDFVSKYVGRESIVSYKITMNKLSQKSTWQNRVDLTWIFIIDDISVLNSFVYGQKHIWKATNRYLIIITTQSITTLSREMFQNIWENYSVHRIVATSIRENFRCLDKYMPFEKNQQSEYGVIRKVCLMGRQNNVKLYDKIGNVNGYPIHIIVFESLMMGITFDKDKKVTKFSKLDADVMSLLEKMMGAEFRIKVISDPDYDDPFHRALGYIQNNKSEMIITSFFIHEYDRYQKYEFTASIYEDKLCLIAPAASFMPKSYLPILPFTADLWTALAIYNLLISIMWFFVKYYSRSFRQRKVVLLPLVKSTKSILSQRSSLPPRIHPHILSCFDLVETWCYPLKEDSGNAGSTAAQRAFLFGTLFFGLIVTGLYQSCLVSNLSEPFRYPELNTLEDVANSNLTIITKYKNLKQNTFTENTTLEKKLKNKIEVLVTDKRTNDIVAFNQKIIALGRFASLKLDNVSKYYDENGNELLHVVEECPTTYLLSYIIRLHSPYQERINWLLLRMREAGLVESWYENMTYPLYVDEQRRKLYKSARRFKLTMEHYSLTFLGLLLGLISCAILFFAELYFAKKFGCRQKKRKIFEKTVFASSHIST